MDIVSKKRIPKEKDANFELPLIEVRIVYYLYFQGLNKEPDIESGIPIVDSKVSRKSNSQ